MLDNIFAAETYFKRECLLNQTVNETWNIQKVEFRPYEFCKAAKIISVGKWSDRSGIDPKI